MYDASNKPKLSQGVQSLLGITVGNYYNFDLSTKIDLANEGMRVDLVKEGAGILVMSENAHNV
jgi:hypothetical protein